MEKVQRKETSVKDTWWCSGKVSLTKGSGKKIWGVRREVYKGQDGKRGCRIRPQSIPYHNNHWAPNIFIVLAVSLIETTPLQIADLSQDAAGARVASKREQAKPARVCTAAAVGFCLFKLQSAQEALWAPAARTWDKTPGDRQICTSWSTSAPLPVEVWAAHAGHSFHRAHVGPSLPQSSWRGKEQHHILCARWSPKPQHLCHMHQQVFNALEGGRPARPDAGSHGQTAKAAVGTGGSLSLSRPWGTAHARPVTSTGEGDHRVFPRPHSTSPWSRQSNNSPSGNLNALRSFCTDGSLLPMAHLLREQPAVTPPSATSTNVTFHSIGPESVSLPLDQ